MTRFLIPLCCVLLCSCVAAPPGPEIYDSAERAILTAERVGAQELSPVELKFAREKLDLAHLAVEQKKYEEAYYAIEQSEINSELAIEQSKAALERRKVNELTRNNEMLREELQNTYGEAFQ